MSDRPDQDIIELLASPDTRREAFDLIVSRYHRRLYEHVRRLVIDHEDAADVVQDIFIKIWKNLGGFRQDAALYTWLYRIASNESLNFIKSRKRRREGLVIPLPSFNSRNVAYHQGPGGEEILEKLMKAIQSLPDKQKLVFHLRYFEELPYEDISQITGTSVGSLKASYHFASKKIEEELKAD